MFVNVIHIFFSISITFTAEEKKVWFSKFLSVSTQGLQKFTGVFIRTLIYQSPVIIYNYYLGPADLPMWEDNDLQFWLFGKRADSGV